MIEFDEYLTTKYTGKEAVVRKIKSRLNHRTTDIPYYAVGFDATLFTYTSIGIAVNSALADLNFSPTITVSGDTTRIKTATVTVDVSGLV